MSTIEEAGSSATTAETTTSDLNEPENPLNNTVILTNLFNVCPIDQLKVHRLVCKQWRDLSTIPWREQAVLHIKYEKGAENEPEEEQKYLAFRNLSLLDNLPKIALNPFLGVHIDGSYRQPRRLGLRQIPALNIGNIAHLKISNRLMCITYIRDLLFTDFSPPLSSFVLENVDIANFSIVEVQREQTILDICPRTNLTLTRFEMKETLWNSTCHDDVLDTPNWTTDDFLRAVLSKAPNIQKLVASSDACDDMEEACDVFFKGLDSANLKINRLDITGVRTRSLPIEYLVALLAAVRDLPLIELKLKPNNMFKGDELGKFFGHNRNTLNSLALQRCGDVGDEPVNLNDVELEHLKCVLTFPKLWHLAMKESFYALIHFLCNSTCSSLQTIELDLLPDRCMETPLLPHLNELRFVDLQKIQISTEYRHDYLSFPGMEMMCFVCPNLRVLEMPLGKSHFRMICKHFLNLTDLRVVGFGKKRWLIHRSQFPLELVDDEAIVGSDGENQEQTPGLKNLTKLSGFALEPQIDENGDKVHLTDTSVYDAFLRMPNLRTLRLNMDKISKHAKEMLHTAVFAVDNICFKTG